MMLLATSSFILLLPLLTHGQGSCPRNMTWQRISYLENSQSISIEVCCNVTTVTAVQVLKDWRLNEPPIIDQQNIDDLVIPGFEMQISTCADGTVAPGNVLRDDCRSEIGKVLQLGYEHIERFDQWYITCFTVANVRRGCNNKFCSLDRYCTNAARCEKVWMTREIVNTTLTNMTILIKVGHVPEGTDLYVEVDEMSPSAYLSSLSYYYPHRQSQGGRPGADSKIEEPREEPKKKFYRTSATAPIGQSLIYEVQNLNPEKYYIVRTCAKLRTPASFFSKYRDYPIPAENLYCLEDATYSPARYRYLSSGHRSAVEFIVLSVMVVFVVLVQ